MLISVLNEKILNKTKVVYSNVCGVGKSTFIKKKAKGKNYIYFPLGGNINKNIIFEKLRKVIEKIKDPKSIIIHLDLYNTEQYYLMTDFLFSFLITKFYSNFEDILSISNDIQIYIEIPNEFTNFLEKFQMIKYFIRKNENEEMKLNDLKSSFEENNIYKISPILEKIYNIDNIDKNKSITSKDLLFKYIKIEKPTYYQIEIFCKCIKSYQVNDLSENKKDYEKIINSIQLFTLNPYSDFIVNRKEGSLIDILTDIDNNIKKKAPLAKNIPIIFDTKSGLYELNNEKIENLKSQNDFLLELRTILSIDNPIDENESNQKDNHDLKPLKKI